MTTAQQHITEAERLLAESKNWSPNSVGAGTLATQASVHVQLAAIVLAVEMSRGAGVSVPDASSKPGGES